MPPSQERIGQLQTMFRRFGEFEAVENRSPLYATLSETVASDSDLLELASHAHMGQPPPNLLFAAVQYLLAGDSADPLAAAYPALAAGRQPPADPGPLFGAFCRAHRDAIIPILRSRLVQTNEVRRSACLLPAFATVTRRTGRPLALIEIGPSAGLNLLFDHYACDYGNGRIAGDPGSPVRLDSEWQSGIAPPTAPPPITTRCGIDLNPLDVTNDDDVRWLRALIWPEHDDRRALLDAAISVARRDPPRLLGGDLFELLPPELDAIPPRVAPCIFATFVLNQFSSEMSARFDALLRERARRRTLSLVLMGSAAALTGERDATAVTSIWLLTYARGERHVERLARSNPHGRWIAWESAS